MTLIALTLTIAGITLHRNAIELVFDGSNHRSVAMYTGTDGVQMVCTSRTGLSWQWGPALIVADQCRPNVIFRGGFQ